MRAYLKFIVHFFPVQLLFLHLRRSWLLLFFWFVLFGMVGGLIFQPIGIPYLFQTPEYLGDVNFLSYFLMGVVCGFFVMAFHIASYIFYSYRYTFLATTTRPLYRFSINNSIIPIAFYLFYAVVIAIALSREGYNALQIFLNESGLFMGSIVSISLSFTYFFSTIRKPKEPTSKDSIPTPIKLLIRKDKNLEEAPEDHVFTYLRNYASIRRVRPSGHYDDSERLKTLQQHHTNAAIYFIALLAFLVILSLFGESSLLLIPAGASLVLIGTTYLMIFGALFSWLKTWTITVIVVGVFVVNYISGLPSLDRTAKLAGMNYEREPVPYTYEAIAEITTDSIIDFDVEQMLVALEGWKARQGVTKPKLVIFNSSGGGLRSSLFTLGAMQYLDSLSAGDFHEQVFMINGSSGGMIGAAYYRELKMQSQTGEMLGINGKPYYDRLGTDILNAVGFALAVNDLFFPLNSFEKAGYRYKVDRGNAWDARLNENTNGILDKPVCFYKEYEKTGEIPLMVLSPTIINRGQRLFISPMGLSFLSKHKQKFQTRKTDMYDGVEFSRYFKDYQADSVSFISALRMSSTFPYITPMVQLPSKPRMEITDAGARDNDGLLLTIRFLHQFKDWIAANTSGVVLVQALASRPVDEEIKDNPYNTRLENLVKPLGSIVANFATLQGFARAEILTYAEDWIEFPLDVIHLDLLETSSEVSLSWHLTEREKAYIYQSLRSDRLAPKVQAVIDKTNKNQKN